MRYWLGILAVAVLVIVVGGLVVHVGQAAGGDGPSGGSSYTLTPAEQSALNNEDNGQPGSWQCIEHFGDQSNC